MNERSAGTQNAPNLQTAIDARGQIIHVAFNLRRKLQRCLLAFDGKPRTRKNLTGEKASNYRGRARSQTRCDGNAVYEVKSERWHLGEARSAKCQLCALDDEIRSVTRKIRCPFTLAGHLEGRDPRSDGKIVIEVQGDAEAVETRPEICAGRRNPHDDPLVRQGGSRGGHANRGRVLLCNTRER